MITYLTVFRSRLGLANLALRVTSFARQPEAAVLRRLTELLRATVELDVTDDANARIFEYLAGKHLVGQTRRGSRYGAYRLERTENSWYASKNGKPVTSMAVFQTDIWMADQRLPSTIGTPTVENMREVLDFSPQLGMVSTANWTWTGAGQLAAGLRGSRDKADNPFVLNLEAPVLLRQLVEHDGFFLRELLRFLAKEEDPISRDEFARDHASSVAEATYQQLREHHADPRDVDEAREYLRLFRETQAKRGSQSGGPGVLEHRVSPRLEWLVDLGALSKRGFPSNAFKYRWTPDAAMLLALMDQWAGQKTWSDEVSLAYWNRSVHWAELRKSARNLSVEVALLRGYGLMDRGIGPASIRDVCFAAGVLVNTADSASDLRRALIALATREGGVSLSGGRYGRDPEMVHIAKNLIPTESA